MQLVRQIKYPVLVIALGLIVLLEVRLFFLTDGSIVRIKAESVLTNRVNSYLATQVNPLIGTGEQKSLPPAYSGGETFPGADAPFGMVQWSPDTVSYAYGGYKYSDDRMRGFSLTHLSGAGCSQYGDIPFMPYTGEVTSSPGSDAKQYTSTFSHLNEHAQAGFYTVHLDNGVETDLSVTQRSGAGRFVYPQGKIASMLVNVSASLNPVSTSQVVIGDDTISGWAESGRFCYTQYNTYRVYFWAQFSQPFLSQGVWHNEKLTPSGTAATGSKAGAYVTFDTRKQSAINVRVGVSFVSVANAEANVLLENPSDNFEVVHHQITTSWNQLLSEINISGGTSEQSQTFYTALYHALLFPSSFSDANGEYLGSDRRIHVMPYGHTMYTNFSGWDIYRSEVQLITLLDPARASDMAQSLVNDYAQSGYLPKWSVANQETYVQVGDPADAIIADIYAFGGTDFDSTSALAAMITQATRPNRERPGLAYMDSPGYEPTNGSYACCNFYGSASTTLEYDTADFAIGAFAGLLGDEKSEQQFVQRAQDWRNLFHPTTGYLEPRAIDGSFPETFHAISDNDWVEGNSAQYTWMVPFNLRGLFQTMGGNARAVERLDTFFAQLNVGLHASYAFMGNEPSIEAPWEYDYAGAPYKTQRVVRQIVNNLYQPVPDGLAGNDDLGEMSSWYVFAAMGMYPETPGTANLALASPLFPNITVYRSGGQTIRISAPEAAANTYYVQSLRVNGQLSTHPWLPPAFIANGGTLDYTLSKVPDSSWGAKATDAPPSYS